MSSATQASSRRVGRGGIGAASPAQADEDAALLAQADVIVQSEQAAAPKPEARKTAASRANPRDNAEFHDEEGKPLRRRVTRGGNPYDIPDRLKKPGWDYQWWAIRVMGEPVDPSALVEVREGGWRPCSARDMKELVPPAWDKPHVERGGQILYMRPMHLTQEARNEDLKIADEQRYEKLKGALAGPQELSKIAPRHVEKIEINGVVGNLERRE